MSALLRIPFANVHINNNHQRGEIGGGVSHRLFPDCYVDKSYLRKHALIAVAGAAAQRALENHPSQGRVNKYDKASVRLVYEWANATDSMPTLKALNTQADEIFEHEKDALLIIAHELLNKGKVSSRFVRKIAGEYSMNRAQAFLTSSTRLQ